MFLQAGSVHVRIRRDADEQMVLAHVMNRLCNVVNKLTVQVFKDDWVRTSAFQVIKDSNIPFSQKSDASKTSSITSKLTSGLPHSYLVASNKLDQPRDIVLPPVSSNSKTHNNQVLPLSQRNLYSSPNMLSESAFSSNRFTPGASGEDSYTPTTSSVKQVQMSHSSHEYSGHSDSYDGHSHKHNGHSHSHG